MTMKVKVIREGQKLYKKKLIHKRVVKGMKCNTLTLIKNVTKTKLTILEEK